MNDLIREFCEQVRQGTVDQNRINNLTDYIHKDLRGIISQCEDKRSNWEINTQNDPHCMLIEKTELQYLASQKKQDISNDLTRSWLVHICDRMAESDRVPVLCNAGVLENLADQVITQELDKHELGEDILFRIAKDSDTEGDWDHPTLQRDQSDIYDEIRDERSFLGEDIYEYIKNLDEEHELYQTIHKFLVTYTEEEAYRMLEGIVGESPHEHQRDHLRMLVKFANEEATRVAKILLDYYYQDRLPDVNAILKEKKP